MVPKHKPLLTKDDARRRRGGPHRSRRQREGEAEHGEAVGPHVKRESLLLCTRRSPFDERPTASDPDFIAEDAEAYRMVSLCQSKACICDYNS